eukprot:3086763-Heterocapsa_arctica.AAC.1
MANSAAGNNCGRDRVEQRRNETNDKERCYCERREDIKMVCTTHYGTQLGDQVEITKSFGLEMLRKTGTIMILWTTANLYFMSM